MGIAIKQEFILIIKDAFLGRTTFELTLSLYGYTAVGIWIASVAIITATRRQMIIDITVGILTTCTRTGILAFELYTRTIRRTFAVRNTFRLAAHIRISKVIR